MTTPHEVQELNDWIDTGYAREWRRAAGLTQETAAAQVGVSVYTFNRWESQHRHPRMTLVRVAYRAALTRWRAEAQAAGPGADATVGDSGDHDV